ncbi:hypothetical protein PTTG_29147 [Puccinia triticina 1-1 BBBD Race 1]|uniref:Uncharacterized protein n=1 Tax=Puccinia triticina (isolate 1-1 / race 1 (BBBD)) TaxID=630390 RepID=A0A180G670_PUCT1|nr:hypothetical protein PTTG_29147 [Puccinia triticina 1-1 BBBD Race 1]
MPKASSYLLSNHKSSTRTRNKRLFEMLPAHNSPLCQALYDFIRLILGVKNGSDKWRSSPSPSQLAQLNSAWSSDTLAETIIGISRQVTATQLDSKTPLHGKKKVLHESHQVIFLRHLEILQFPHAAFNWNEPHSSPWNQALTNLILTHWIHAQENGAFSAYPMDPTAASDPNTLTGLIHRWFNGRQDEVKKEERNPGSSKFHKKLIQKSHFRKRLSEHRTDTLRRLRVDSKFHEIFEDPLCISDTEKEEDGKLVKVNLAWRSTVATKLAARVDGLTIRRKREDNGRAFGPGQLLENRRQQPTQIRLAETTRIPRCQPEDFYAEEFLQSLGKAAKEELSIQPPLGLLDLWFNLDCL